AMSLVDAGRRVLMCVGEPDFDTPARVIAAATAALARGETHYTIPAGIPELRSAISRHYRDRYGVDVPSDRILVTAGASAALTLAFGALAEPGDEFLMADPGYPSNRAFLTFCGARAGLVPVGAADRFQLTPELVERHWTPATRGVMVASPANPTGTSIPDDTLRAIHEVVRARGGTLVVDEIYHGLTYGHAPQTAAALGDDVFVVNSFSKYFCMTGWRLGWLVMPEPYAPAIERIAQHLYIAAATPSQWAGVAAMEPESIAIFDAQCAEFQKRRDWIIPALREIGLPAACEPDGAFYVYVDCSAYTVDSWDFARELLHETGVAVTPGRDFGTYQAERYVRISYTSSLPQLQEAVARIGAFLKERKNLR
ncbi:MAG: aminotransferase class I/II-fold pyridoxal phosphate-dependent enzyme, partial [Gemmatimonadaceae bacterium]